MRWHVPLLGEHFDLNNLEKTYKGDEYRVVRDARLGYLLEGDRFERMNDDTEVYSEAVRLLRRMNALARMDHGSRPEVRAAAPYERMQDGKLIASATAHVTAGATVWAEAAVLRKVNGVLVEVQEPESPSSHRMQLAEDDSAVAAALDLFGAGDSLDWVRLYSLLEILQNQPGGYKGVAVVANVSLSMIHRIERTACSPEVIGIEARHGVQKQQAPSDPVALVEARQVVTALLKAWLDRLQQPGIPPARAI